MFFIKNSDGVIVNHGERIVYHKGQALVNHTFYPSLTPDNSSIFEAGYTESMPDLILAVAKVDRYEESDGVVTAVYKDDATFSTADELKQKAKDVITKSRKEFERSGITMPDGSVISTDQDDQNRINGAWATIQQNPSAVIDFKGEGGWAQLDGMQITAIAKAVSDHVQSCFSKERLLHEQIDAIDDESDTLIDDLKSIKW